MSMKKLLDFFKSMRDERASGRRVFRHGDPAKGIEYNQINTAYKISKKIWSVDIARTPQVVRGLGDRIDVHGEAWLANRMNSMIDYKSNKCKGRGR